MTAKELIRELQQVSPDTPVTISTNGETREIERVARMGYSDQVFTIVID